MRFTKKETPLWTFYKDFVNCLGTNILRNICTAASENDFALKYSQITHHFFEKRLFQQISISLQNSLNVENNNLCLKNSEFLLQPSEDIFLATLRYRIIAQSQLFIFYCLSMLVLYLPYSALPGVFSYLGFFWSVFSRIWTECIHSKYVKIRIRETPNMDTFQAVLTFIIIFLFKSPLFDCFSL